MKTTVDIDRHFKENNSPMNWDDSYMILRDQDGELAYTFDMSVSMFYLKYCETDGYWIARCEL